MESGRFGSSLGPTSELSRYYGALKHAAETAGRRGRRRKVFLPLDASEIESSRRIRGCPWEVWASIWVAKQDQIENN